MSVTGTRGIGLDADAGVLTINGNVVGIGTDETGIQLGYGVAMNILGGKLTAISNAYRMAGLGLTHSTVTIAPGASLETIGYYGIRSSFAGSVIRLGGTLIATGKDEGALSDMSGGVEFTHPDATMTLTNGPFSSGSFPIRKNFADADKYMFVVTGGLSLVDNSACNLPANTTGTLSLGRVSNPDPTPASDPVPIYTYSTLIDQPTGITVKGRMTQVTRLSVKDQILHTGTCDACDEIRARQAEGRILVYADIALSGGYSGEQEVSLPVDPQYNGQIVTILHCNNGVLEQVVVTVQNGMATGKFKKLSPYAVMIGERVGVPDQILVNPPKTGDNNTPLGFLLVLMALAISAKAVRFALKNSQGTVR